MTSATKVFLALFALLIGVLVLYYGVWQRADSASVGISSVSGATPATVSQLPRRSNESVGRLGRSGTSTLRTQNPSGTAGQSGLLTDALLQQANLPPPPATDTSLDSFAAATETTATTSRPVANAPVAISLNGPTPAGPEIIDPTVTASNTLPSPSKATETNSTGEVQPRISQPTSTTTGSSTPELEYIVKAGDTGTSIAKAWFGDPNKWVLISKANPWADFNRLRIGQKLKMPPKDATSVKAPAAQPVAMGERATYTVQAGDTLAAIARKQLGNAGLWDQLYQANKAVIGDDPAALQVGMKLKLPDKNAKRQ